MTTSELVKEALTLYFTKREPMKIAALMADNAYLCGFGEINEISGREEIKRFLSLSAQKNRAPYQLSVQTEKPLPGNGALIIFSLSRDGETAHFRITANAENGLICTAHCARLSGTLGNILPTDLFMDDLLRSMDGDMATLAFDEAGHRTIPVSFSEQMGAKENLSRAEYFSRYSQNAMLSIHPDDRERVWQSMLETVHHAKPGSVSFRICQKDGTPRWINGTYSKFGEQGGLPLLRVIFTPVSIQYDLQLQALSQEGTGIYVTDSETDELYYANDAIFRLHSLAPRDYAGMKCYQAFFGCDQMCAQCVGRQCPDENKPIERTVKTKDKYLNLHVETRMWNGKRVLVVYATDVTEKILMQNKMEEASRELHQSDQMIMNACDFAEIWVWAYDIQKDLIYYYKKLRDDFGMPETEPNFPDEWLKHGFVLPESIPLYREMVQRIKDGENSVLFESHIQFRDNTAHWVRIRMNRMTGTPDTVIGTAQLIDNEKYLSARVEMEEKRQTEGGANLLAHFTTNITRDLPLEHSYHFSEINALLCWKSLKEQATAISNYIPVPESREAFLRIHDSAYLLAQFEEGVSEHTLEYRRMLPDGHILWVRNVLHLLRDPHTGDVINYETLYDIHRVKIYEEMMTAMVESGVELCASLMLDADQITSFHAGRQVGSNTLTIAAYSAAFAQYVENVLPEDRDMLQREYSLDAIRRQMKKQNHFEIIHRTMENGEIHYKKEQCDCYSADRSACMLLRSDVTDIVQMEQEKRTQLQKALKSAEAATQAKSEFLSRMSHEIRTPMNAIMGMTAIAKDNRSDFMQVSECLDKIDMSSHYLLTLINDILAMSRIESGKTEIRKAEFSFSFLLDSIRTVVEPLAVKSEIRYECIVSPEAEACYRGDAMRIQQVMVNLITNAIKFTKPNGRVRFSIDVAPSNDTQVKCIFTVADTGIGMSEEFMQRMFQPFTQEDGSNTSRYGGSGLGLAISKSLTEAMGGHISAESFPGVGSTFIVELPLERTRTAPLAVQTKSAKPEADDAILAGCKVLMAEDHPLNVMVAKKLLEKKKVSVTVAENGKLALDEFMRSVSGTFDAILMDIRMPVMDGLDAARAIRAQPREDAKTIPIIAMTANALDEDRQHTKSAGMNAHLAKPFEPQQLYAVLAEQIAKARKK